MSKHRPSTPSSLSSGSTSSRPLSAQSHDMGFVGSESTDIDVGDYFDIEDDDDKTMHIPLEVQIRTVHSGRSYHSYPDAVAMEPIDSTQQSEWEAMEQIWHRQALLLPPIISQPNQILDVGTGSGSWAIMMADKYPTANVRGIDLAPVQSTSVPPNCQFLVDNAEKLPWYDTDDSFDIIHMQQLHWAKDWSALFQEAFRCLAPGGWFEWADLQFLPMRDGNALYWQMWQSLQDEIYYGSGHSRSARNVAQTMEETGFINVATRWEYVLEGEDWELREYIDTEGMTAPLHTVFDINKEAIRPLVDGMKKELTEMTSAVRVKAIQVFAQKPTVDRLRFASSIGCERGW